MLKLKVFGGILIAVVIGLLTLYFLLRTFNKIEAKKVEGPKMEREFIKRGNLSIFPQWDEIAEFPPESEIRYFGHDKGKVLFDVNYKVDDKGFRVEEQTENSKTSHLLVGGCSFIFGIAVNAQDTLSSKLRTSFPHVNVQNFGHGGGGLHTQLRMFDLINLKNMAPEEKGTYVYFFFDDHLHRWKGTPSYMSWAQADDIHYEKGSKTVVPKSLKLTEKYKEFQKMRDSGLDMVYIRTKALAQDGWNLEDLNDFVGGVKLLKKKYLDIYPNGRFVFAFHPYSPDLDTLKKLAAILDKENIEYRDFREDFNKHVTNSKIPPSHFNVPLDGHPNGKFNAFLAARLISSLAAEKKDGN